MLEELLSLYAGEEHQQGAEQEQEAGSGIRDRVDW